MNASSEQQSANELSENEQPVLVHTQQWQGPLPPPAVLQQYDTVIEGLAERLVSTMEREQSHRHAMERTMLETHTSMYKRGQFIAAFIALASIASGLLLGIQGHTTIAIAFITSGIGAMITKRVIRHSSLLRRLHVSFYPGTIQLIFQGSRSEVETTMIYYIMVFWQWYPRSRTSRRRSSQGSAFMDVPPILHVRGHVRRLFHHQLYPLRLTSPYGNLLSRGLRCLRQSIKCHANYP
ncbi:MAG: DUF2335 domain-containing protein [Candidatus Kapaibacterium sp.]